MSEFKDKYYEHKKIADLNFEGHIDDIDNYVKELENQNKEMLEALIKKVKTGYRNGKPVYDGEIRDIIEKATGLKIEEVIK